MNSDEIFMSRCIQLAKLGAGNVAPNPMVGAVLVCDNRIIGEGYHATYGQAHAEVNCINNVPRQYQALIEKSTLYVSLEPCSHFGKTPPCSCLIIRQKIKRVVIGCRDIYEKVDGKGIEKLQNAGLEVITGVLGDQCRDLNKRFFTFHQQKRPFIILKWAQSANGKIGSEHGQRVLISNDYSNRMVHKWRSEEAGILIGYNTALRDNPSLTSRLWKGKNPVRIVVDPLLKLPGQLKIFDGESKTILYNLVKDSSEKNIKYIRLKTENLLEQMLSSLYENKIQSILVEGGAKTLQFFIGQNLWDEARVVTNGQMVIGDGVGGPMMKNFKLVQIETLFSDTISYFTRK